MGFSLKKLNPVSVIKSVVSNPLPGITGGVPGVTNSGLLDNVSLTPTSIKDARAIATKLIENAKKQNDQAVRTAGAPARASGINYLQWADQRAQKFNNALSTDAAENAKLAANTRNLNSGILEKSNRAEVTRMNPALHAKLQSIGTAVGSTGIPIVSQIGMGVAGIEAARRREAGLINNRQFGASLAGTALAGGLGPQLGGGWQGAAMRGGVGGAVNAYGADRPILEGAATGAAAGGLGHYLGGLGKDYGVNPALTRTGVGAATGAIRGGSQGAYEGAVQGGLSGIGGEYGGRIGAAAGGLLASNYLAGQRADSMRNQAISAMQQQLAQRQQQQQALTRQMPALMTMNTRPVAPAINQLPFAQRYWQRG